MVILELRRKCDVVVFDLRSLPGLEAVFLSDH